ncbi:hypothetical protein [Arthrobacter sp. Soil764]|nr:hypothetical protein [Arthrobacter sp. Soil764]
MNLGRRPNAAIEAADSMVTCSLVRERRTFVVVIRSMTSNLEGIG